MITDKLTRQAQTGSKIYVLIFAYEEPEPGLHTIYAELTPQEFKKVQYILTWFNEHGDNGEYLATWMTQEASEQPTNILDYPSLIQEIRLQSRYDEGDYPGDFYGGPNPYLMDN